MKIALAETSEQIARCYPVMAQLRPHLSEQQFIEQVVRQQQNERFHLAALYEDNEICALAGFRLMEKLSRGKCVYVDDLITDAERRSMGYGEALLDWLIEWAQSQKCDAFILDSGVQRAGAHRFYFRHGLHVAGFHFALELES